MAKMAINEATKKKLEIIAEILTWGKETIVKYYQCIL